MNSGFVFKPCQKCKGLGGFMNFDGTQQICPECNNFGGTVELIAEHDKQIRKDTIDEFVEFMFGRNVMHNQRFTTREEEYFLNIAEQFKRTV